MEFEVVLASCDCGDLFLLLAMLKATGLTEFYAIYHEIVIKEIYVFGAVDA